MIFSMENLTNLLSSDDGLEPYYHILMNASTIAYLANDKLNYDEIAAKSEINESYKSAREKFLSAFFKNFQTLKSTQKNLDSLFTMHGYFTMPYSVNSMKNRTYGTDDYSWDSYYVIQIPEDFYNYVTGIKKTTSSIVHLCRKIKLYNIFRSLEFDYPTDLYDILKYEFYNDPTYDLIHEFVISMLKQKVMVDAICDKFKNGFKHWPEYYDGSSGIFVSTLLELLEEKNVERKKEFWNSNITSALVKNHIYSKNITTNNKIAKSLSEDLKQNYTKTGYVYGVGVYKAIDGHYDHAFYGNDIMNVTVLNVTDNKSINVFIMRANATAKSYKECSILNSIQDRETEICKQTNRGRNLHSLIKWIHKQCPNLYTVAVVRFNLDFYGSIPKKGMMSKSINFNQCYFGFTLYVAFKPDD